MSYHDVPNDVATRLRDLGPDELSLERATLSDECDKLARHDKLTNAQDTKLNELLDQRDFIDHLVQKRALEAKVRGGDFHEVVGHDTSLDAPTTQKRSVNVNYLSSGKAWQVRDGAAGDELRGRAVDALVGLDASDETIQRAANVMLDQGRHLRENNELAHRIAVCSSPDYARAFQKIALDPVSGHNSLTTKERAAWDQMLESKARAAMSGTNTAGALVPTHLDPTIILTNNGTSNVIRQMSREVQLAAGNVWHGISSAGVSASYDGELVEVSDDTPTFSNPSISVTKAQALVQGSIEAFEDIANIQSEILRMFQDAKDRLEENKFTVGSGTGEPKGVFTAVAAVTASRVVSTTAATIGVVDLKSVYLAVPARHRRVSRWLTNPTWSLGVKDLGTAVNASYSGDLRDPSASKWYDIPVAESDDAPAVTTTTALDSRILLGSFEQFLIVDRLGASAEFIPHMFNTSSNLPDGRRGVYFHWRNGSDVTDVNAFRLLVDKTSA